MAFKLCRPTTTRRLTQVVAVATGAFSSAIRVLSTTGVADVTVEQSAQGGWDGVQLAYGVYFANGAAGGASQLTNLGAIRALSDRAIGSVPRGGGHGGVQTDNFGTVTGFVAFANTTGGNVTTFNNQSGGLFDVRNFADIDGDGSRDVKAVSVSTFGGAGSTFNNMSGALVKLAAVDNPTSINTANYYVPTTGPDSRPLESSFYNIGRAGVSQGQFTNLSTFGHSGTIDLRGPAVGNTLVITGGPAITNGSPVGNGIFVSNGGRLLLNSVLNSGVVPGGQTNSFSDVLIVDSTSVGAGGPTKMQVTNVGGAGAPTPGNGIEVVEVRNKAASAPGVFVLQGQYVTPQGLPAIVGGAYAYSLYHNGVGADSADGNWYLRSQFYQPGVPVYEMYPQLLLQFGQVGTMAQRIGDRYTEVRVPDFCHEQTSKLYCTESVGHEFAASSGRGGLLWARIEGERGRLDPSFSTSDATSSGTFWMIQSGIDAMMYQSAYDDRLFAGISGHYGKLDASVASPSGDGSIDTDGYGVEGNVTWLGSKGLYLDAVARATWYRSDLTSDTAGSILADGNSGFGYALSLEAGQRLDMWTNWSLTPQAQLGYAAASFSTFTDPFGAVVSLDQAHNLIGRIGSSLDYRHAWFDEAGRVGRANIYGIANLYYQFIDGAEVSVAGVQFNNEIEPLWGGLGLGGTYAWADDAYAVYGEATVRTALEDFGDSYFAGGTLGVRAHW